MHTCVEPQVIQTPVTCSYTSHLCVQRIIIHACLCLKRCIHSRDIHSPGRKGRIWMGHSTVWIELLLSLIQHSMNRVTLSYTNIHIPCNAWGQLFTFEVRYHKCGRISSLRWQIMATGRKTPAEPRSIPLWQLSDSKPKISLQQVRGNFNYRGIDL